MVGSSLSSIRLDESMAATGILVAAGSRPRHPGLDGSIAAATRGHLWLVGFVDPSGNPGASSVRSQGMDKHLTYSLPQGTSAVVLFPGTRGLPSSVASVGDQWGESVLWLGCTGTGASNPVLVSVTTWVRGAVGCMLLVGAPGARGGSGAL